MGTIPAIFLIGLATFTSAPDGPAQVNHNLPSVPRPPNILVIVADDVGVDVLAPYGEGFAFACSASRTECQTDADCPRGEWCLPNLPPTPTLQSLADGGILFRNVWGNPSCSPTRATVQTGRFGFRTGVLYAYDDLPLGEFTIPEVLALPISKDNPTERDDSDTEQLWRYAHAAIGKWHLGGGPSGPMDHGYSRFAGTEHNIANYFDWTRVVDGAPDGCYAYATVQNVDDALAWIGQQTGPWFMWLAFNAAHFPFHAPPDHLHSYHGDVRPELPPVSEIDGRRCHTDERLCYLAMIEAMDLEVARLLDGLTPLQRERTTIIFLGDNGTPGTVTVPPFDPNHAKFTLFEGGVNVPMIISGNNVVNPGRESAALVNTTDLFATILALAGRPVTTALPPDYEIDSVSLLPIVRDTASGELRECVYSENLEGQTVRNEQGYKLIRQPDQPANLYQLYDLAADPFETTDLYDDAGPNLTPEQQLNLDRLLLMMRMLLDEPTSCPRLWECSEVAGCSPSGPCFSIEESYQFCQHEDGTLLSCGAGQVVHIERCPCVGGPACPLTDQRVVCE